MERAKCRETCNWNVLKVNNQSLRADEAVWPPTVQQAEDRDRLMLHGLPNIRGFGPAALIFLRPIVFSTL